MPPFGTSNTFSRPAWGTTTAKWNLILARTGRTKVSDLGMQIQKLLLVRMGESNKVGPAEINEGNKSNLMKHYGTAYATCSYKWSSKLYE